MADETDDTTIATDQAYMRGNRAAWSRILTLAAGELGADTTEGELAALLAEREAAVVALRDICEEHGSTAWGDDLHLADVIEKHLGRQLDETTEQATALLRELEWGGTDYTTERSHCHICGGDEPTHRDNCKLDACLRARST